ncbi:PREDICTED: neuropeptide-like protein 33 isoform X2 [Dinoponera quadriceps]|uniref:Neuropeptide-like protein 33 isoform X2 n=1 Tax=Dinoponera quadriceps TaxID=609295 RepID=A0A6P3Y1R3_DINQU|nr:PREDICTED: neuropeptide-like protein 33 isoform X2 [Dinoponera quadriceps]
MESVFNMLRPLHFVLLLSAFAFFASASALETKEPIQSEVETPTANSDLEADASAYWGYGRPYYGGWGYGRYPGYYGGWGGRYYGGRGYWGGRGWGGYGGYWG